MLLYMMEMKACYQNDRRSIVAEGRSGGVVDIVDIALESSTFLGSKFCLADVLLNSDLRCDTPVITEWLIFIVAFITFLYIHENHQ